MYFILYTSQATLQLSEADFIQLLTQCNQNNTRLGITGLLLYHNDKFLQIIEGEKESVQALYNTIHFDHRHQDVTIVEAGDQTGRNFPDWAMGFKGTHNGSRINIPAYINLSENQLLFNHEGQISHPALPHLEKFYEQLN